MISAGSTRLSVPPYFGAWPDGVVAAGLVVVGGAVEDVVGGAVVVVGAGVVLAQALTAIISRNANAVANRDLLIYFLLAGLLNYPEPVSCGRSSYMRLEYYAK